MHHFTASVFHEQTTSPNLSPIGPASHRFIDDSVLSDYSGNPNGKLTRRCSCKGDYRSDYRSLINYNSGVYHFL